MENKRYSEILNDRQNKIAEKVKKKRTKKNKKGLKGIIIAALAIIAAGAVAVTCFIFRKKNDGAKQPEPTSVTTTTTNNMSLDELGMEIVTEPTTKPTQQYGDVTGEVNIEEIVEDENGTIWVDEEALEKADEVGNVTIDDQGGTLEVKPNGEVHVKEDGIEIEKEDGTKETMTPEEFEDKYVYDENLGYDVVVEDAGKFVLVGADYYDMNGELIYSKDDEVTPEILEKIQNDPWLTTVKPKTVNSTTATTKQTTTTIKQTTTTTTKPTVTTTTTTPVTSTETFTPISGVVNADGTYTIDGFTFESKADYEQWVIQGYTGYGMDLDGIMKPEEEIIANYQKTR